ncbi:hypothetical protein HYW55_04150 [Candidatus Gottesmanbacteria bacterium]|nr:hypothetical protein [Candidatus Gottesmanbacteria bacterium]
MSLEKDKEEKLRKLQEKLSFFEGKLKMKMRRYRGVVHESASSEMKHQEVMVLKAMVTGLQKEIQDLLDIIKKK